MVEVHVAFEPPINKHGFCCCLTKHTFSYLLYPINLLVEKKKLHKNEQVIDAFLSRFHYLPKTFITFGGNRI